MSTNNFEDDETQILKAEFAPCKLCKGSKVIRERRENGQSEFFDCDCVDEEFNFSR